MVEQSILSDDMTLKRVFQDFYRVPDYQREYVWGEADPKGERGDEVEQFLKDIHEEFENASNASAPEYFIGTIVVCPADDGVFNLIDGQQRATTAFLILCAIRDLLKQHNHVIPDDLAGQISASSTDWRGQTVRRERLDLQYEDSCEVLVHYARGEWDKAPTEGTRSIANLSAAYATINEFLKTEFKEDAELLLSFYGYFTNKVKLIRIQTASVSKALKIFETINDRGVGLDAMDLLKNLLFMTAPRNVFIELKETWKTVIDTIYGVREKPLRFLRYFLLASYDVDAKFQEDAIYDWFLSNDQQTHHVKNPLAFAKLLLDAAQAYAGFMEGRGPLGDPEAGIVNTRLLGGSAARQHYILLLAGRTLPSHMFSRLADEVENLMFVYLITNTGTKAYEPSMIDGAKRLRSIESEGPRFDNFCKTFFTEAKKHLSRQFDASLLELRKGDTRVFRLRYLLAKLTQFIDIKAYGAGGGRGNLESYLDGNDIEHILPEKPSSSALKEFGENRIENDLPQKLGNLALVEKAINRLLGNKPYSEKVQVYSESKYLLIKCQGSQPTLGKADKITKAATSVPSFKRWNRDAIDKRQTYLAGLAREVWTIPSA